MCTCIYTYALRCAATATGNIMPKNALCELSMAVSCVGHTPCARRIHMCTQQTGPQTQIANRTWHKTRMHAHTAHDAPWTCANKHGKYESSHEPLPSCTLPRQSSSGELRAHITGSLPSYPVTNAMTHGICAQHPIYIATLPASTPQSRMPQAIMSRGKGVAPIAHYLMRLLPHPTTGLPSIAHYLMRLLPPPHHGPLLGPLLLAPPRRPKSPRRLGKVLLHRLAH